MEYLKKINFTEEDIKDIIDNIENQDIMELEFNEDRVISIIEYLISLGIKDIKSILIYKTNIFYDDLDSIKRRFEDYNGIDIVELINENLVNFDLIGI